MVLPRSRGVTEERAEKYIRGFELRISPRFSLEYGIRYSVIPPWHSGYNNLSAFMLSGWNAAKAPQVAANGTLVPATRIVFRFEV